MNTTVANLTSVRREQIPPNDTEAEAALLGAMFFERAALDDARNAGITIADFYEPNHALIYDAIATVRARDDYADTTTVAAELADRDQLDRIGGRQRLVTIQIESGTSAGAAHYARRIHELATDRRVIATAGELAAAAYTSDRERILTLLEQLRETSHTPGPDERYEPGGQFLFTGPEGIPAIWGHDDEVLWAAGEALIICGPPGVGKTTLMTQIVLARLGLTDNLLGYPITPTTGRVLYLAADRPAQIRRAFRRLVTPDQEAHLNQHLTVWKGPPARDFAKHPDTLLAMCRAAKADTVIIDSLKDVAIGLASDEVGSALNNARQLALANGIEVAELHHQRKGQEGRKPKTLEDLYGSTWISAGAGSIVLLWGQAGDLVVELTHIKQPGAPVGPLELEHDHDAGTTTISRGAIDPLKILRGSPNGITTNDLARLRKDGGDPTKNERDKARRSLEKLVRKGLAHRTEPKVGGHEGTQPSRYYAIDQEEEAS